MVANVWAKTKHVSTQREQIRSQFVLCVLWFLSLALVYYILVFQFYFCCFYSSLGTQWFISLVHLLLVSILIPCNTIWSFDFVVHSCPGFVIIVLVFLVPHIKSVYLAFFILISIFKVSLWTRASALDVFDVLVCWSHHSYVMCYSKRYLKSAPLVSDF